MPIAVFTQIQLLEMDYKCRFYLYLFIAFFLAVFPVSSQVSGKKFVVVIDAGHGGKDPGAIGKIIREKTRYRPVVHFYGFASYNRVVEFIRNSFIGGKHVFL